VRSDGVYAMEEFDWDAVADELQVLVRDLGVIIERRRRAVELEEGLRAYYFAEELARDPAYAYFIEPLEKMRAAYERAFGRPIPPRGKK
jgi:hypothetical protein